MAHGPITILHQSKGAYIRSRCSNSEVNCRILWDQILESLEACNLRNRRRQTALSQGRSKTSACMKVSLEFVN